MGTRWPAAALAVVATALVLAGCGGNSTTTTVPKARTCEELAEEGVQLLSLTFAEIDRLEAEGNAFETVPPVLEAFREETARKLARQTELECKPENIDAYFCANVDRLDPKLPIAAEMLAETVQATC